MALTTAQLQTLKAAILADPTLAAKPNNTDGNFDIAAAMNAIATPDFFVWRTSVPIDEIMRNGFDWTRVDNLTVGKSRIWEWMTAIGTIKPNQDNVRAGVLAVFTTALDQPNRLAVFGHCQRQATRAEKLFATGTGATTTDQGVGPAQLTFEGNLSYQDVTSARNS
jgi:hypothetical protein